MDKFKLSLLITIIFISSCGPAKSIKPIPQPLPSPSDNWKVKLIQSGGFSGVLLIVEVASDGQLIAEDQRSQQSVTQILSTETTAGLKRLIFNIPESTSRVPQTGCADCFIYDLEIQSEGNNVKIHVDDVTINDSGLRDLITTLIRIRDGALRPNP